MQGQSIICYNDYVQDPAQYATRSVTDSSTQGAAVSGYPIANVLDPNVGKGFRRSGLSSGQKAIIDLRLDPRHVYGILTGAVVVPSVRCWVESTGVANACLIDCKIDSTSFGGTTVFDGRGYEVPGVRPVGSACPIFLFAGLAGDVTDQYYGGFFPTASSYYVRLEISPTGAPSACTIEVGRVGLTSVFWSNLALDGGLQYSIDDMSIVQYAEDGTPYVRRKTARRKVKFALTNLRNAHVLGAVPVGASINQRSTLQMLNRLSGRSAPVAFAPFEPLRDSGVNYLASSTYRYLNEGVFGMFSAPIEAELAAGVGGTSDFQWRASAEILEIVP
jgi:hypothetical protein